MRYFVRTALLILAGCGGGASAQPAPTPAQSPTQTPVPPYTLVMPPGYQKVAAGGHTALCLPADAAWVKQALADVRPATRPTTMPADLLKRVAEQRPAVVRQMVADLALPDDKDPNRLFDELVIPTLRKLDALKPPVYLLVCTREQLRQLAATGWGEPRFHYNRVAGAVSYDHNIRLAIDRPMDDTVLPAIFDEKDAPDVRAKKLAAEIQILDANLAQMIAAESQPAVFNRVAQHIDERHFQPLKLRRDQEWLAIGVNGYFTGKYGAQLTPHPREQWMRDLTYEDQRFPVASRSIDLTRPLDPAVMRPAAVPYYNQAMRRKAMAVVNQWAARAGDASIGKVLAAIRTNPPADGAALVKLIRDVGGVDLSKDLAAQ